MAYVIQKNDFDQLYFPKKQYYNNKRLKSS